MPPQPPTSPAVTNPFAPMEAALNRVTGAFTALQRAMNGLFTALDGAMKQLGGEIARFVDRARPDVVQRWTRALQDAEAVIGRTLTPTLEKFTGIIRKVGDLFAGLDEASQKLLNGLAGGAGLVGAAGALAGVVTGLVAALAAAVGAVGALAVAFPEVTGVVAAIGVAVAAVGGLVAALGGMALATADGKQAVAAIGAALRPLFEAFQAYANTVLPPLVALAKELGGVFGSLAAVAGNLLKAVVNIGGPVNAAVADLFTAVAAAVKPLADILATVTTASAGLAAQFGGLVGALIRVISGPVQVIGRVIGAQLQPVAEALARVVAPLAEGLEAVGAVFGELGRVFGELAAEVGALVGSALGGLVRTVLELSPAVRLLTAALERFAEVARFAAAALGIKSKPFQEGDSTGAARRGAQILDLQSYANKAYTSSAGMGMDGGSIDKQQLGTQKQMLAELRRIGRSGLSRAARAADMTLRAASPAYAMGALAGDVAGGIWNRIKLTN